MERVIGSGVTEKKWLLSSFSSFSPPSPTLPSPQPPTISHQNWQPSHPSRSQSSSGVIHLTDNLVDRFLTTAPIPRPYSPLVFFDGAQLRHKSDLHLPELRSEFGLVSSSFLTNNPDPSPSSKLFFCEIEFGESQRSFSLFGLSSLPHVRFVSPNGGTSASSSEAMDPGAFSRIADSMAEFVEAKSGISVGQIHRPPPISTKQIYLLIITALIAAPFAISKVLRGETMLHDWKIWMIGSVFVYFFSVAGTIHNIIRKTPMLISDRNDPNKLVFFYQRSGMQLGAEGFAVGFLYTIVGLAITVVRKMKDQFLLFRTKTFHMRSSPCLYKGNPYASFKASQIR